MTDLINAIKAFDITTVRKIIQNKEYWSYKQDYEIDSILAVAKVEGHDYIDKNGIKRIEVSLLLQFGWSRSYTISELRQLLVDLISELSEDCYSAGWYQKIEFQLWELIHNKASELTLKLWQKRGDMEAVKDLNLLKQITQSWAIWYEDAEDPTIIMLEEWIKLAKSD